MIIFFYPYYKPVESTLILDIYFSNNLILSIYSLICCTIVYDCISSFCLILQENQKILSVVTVQFLHYYSGDKCLSLQLKSKSWRVCTVPWPSFYSTPTTYLHTPLCHFFCKWSGWQTAEKDCPITSLTPKWSKRSVQKFLAIANQK